MDHHNVSSGDDAERITHRLRARGATCDALDPRVLVLEPRRRDGEHDAIAGRNQHVGAPPPQLAAGAADEDLRDVCPETIPRAGSGQDPQYQRGYFLLVPPRPECALRITSVRCSSASSSSIARAYISSEARILRARVYICFSPVESPFSNSRIARFRTTSASS